jgi:hypothetical protein
MNSKKPIIYEEPRRGDVRRFFGSNLIAQALIGYKPQVDLEEGLQLTIKWYRDLFDQKRLNTACIEPFTWRQIALFEGECASDQFNVQAYNGCRHKKNGG